MSTPVLVQYTGDGRKQMTNIKLLYWARKRNWVEKQIYQENKTLIT